MESGVTTHKFVAVVNKNLESGVALNAVAHMALGLVARAATEHPDVIGSMKFLQFVDKDGGIHPSISALSFIILRGTSNEIRKLRVGFQGAGILFVDFTQTMTGDTYVEQLERTGNTAESEMEYYGICAFGLKTQLDPLTRKLSLWR